MRRASTPLSKGFNDLVRGRAARDPDFACASAGVATRAASAAFALDHHGVDNTAAADTLLHCWQHGNLGFD